MSIPAFPYVSENWTLESPRPKWTATVGTWSLRTGAVCTFRSLKRSEDIRNIFNISNQYYRNWMECTQQDDWYLSKEAKMKMESKGHPRKQRNDKFWATMHINKLGLEQTFPVQSLDDDDDGIFLVTLYDYSENTLLSHNLCLIFFTYFFFRGICY